MKAMLWTTFGFVVWVTMTAAVHGGPLVGGFWDDSPTVSLEVPFEVALALDFTECNSLPNPATLPEECILPAELVQSIQLAFLHIEKQTVHDVCWICIDEVHEDPCGIYPALSNLLHLDERVRLRSIEYLRQQRFHWEADALVALLTSDRSPAVREAAAKSLTVIGSGSYIALQALRRAAKEDKSPEVRRIARFAAEILQPTIGKEEIPCIELGWDLFMF